jgi:2-methylisocitrate lyase-like PEP mutase family enzyme
VAPKPLNVLALNTRISLAEYADLGVRRISVGGSLARVAWAAVLAAAQGLQQGELQSLSTGAPSKVLNAMFAGD